PYHARLPAGLLDLFRSRLRENMRLNVDTARDLARTEHLEPIAQLVDNAARDQAVHRKGVAFQLFQILQIHDRVLLLENIGKTALRQTAVQRHLAAFEAAHDAVARNGARALVTAGRRLAPAGTHTAADAFFPVLLPGGWFE